MAVTAPRSVVAVLGSLALALTLVSGPPATSARAKNLSNEKSAAPAVIGKKVIGRSVRGRPIVAWHLGNARSTRTAVVMSSMHGNENDPQKILIALRDGRRVQGLNLWVIPSYNPDGVVRGTRKNAHGVDLNRNFPYRWANLNGATESGPRPSSEPETRAVMRFLRSVRPRWIVSFHQPLHGVDTDTKSPALARSLARHLNLPRKRFRCGGVCHGTMTGWYNHNFRGAAITVEYGPNPSRNRMQRQAPLQLLRALGGTR